MVRVAFHLDVEIDHKDQIPPILDDLRGRYGFECHGVWADYVIAPDPDTALSFDEVEAAGLDGTLRSIG